MSILIPSEKGYQCNDCVFNTEDIFIFLDHCDISYNWNIILGGGYSLDLFGVLNELNNCLQKKDTKSALELIQTVSLAMVNASEGGKNFHRFINEALTSELASDMVKGIEEMLKNNDKRKDT